MTRPLEGAPVSCRTQNLFTLVVIGGLIAVLWLGAGRNVPQVVPSVFAAAALIAFLLLPAKGAGVARLFLRAIMSLGLAALAGGVVWLAIETRAIAMSIALYFVLWWTLLFAVLPFGVRSQREEEAVAPGSDPGAPVHPLLLRKVFATSLVAAIALVIVLLFLLLRPIPNVLPFG